MPALPLTVLRHSSSTNVGTFHAFRNTPLAYFYGKPILRPFFSKLHGHIAVSSAARDFVGEYFPADYRVIPNGIDFRRFTRPPSRSSSSPTIDRPCCSSVASRSARGCGSCCVPGRWCWPHPEARLVVVGRGRPLDGYRRFAPARAGRRTTCYSPGTSRARTCRGTTRRRTSSAPRIPGRRALESCCSKRWRRARRSLRPTFPATATSFPVTARGCWSSRRTRGNCRCDQSVAGQPRDTGQHAAHRAGEGARIRLAARGDQVLEYYAEVIERRAPSAQPTACGSRACDAWPGCSRGPFDLTESAAGRQAGDATQQIKRRCRTAAEAPARALGRLGFTPNALTIVGSLLTGSVGLLVAQGWFVAGVALWLFSPTDTLDGALARATDRVSVFGAFLDSVCDRYAEVGVFLGLVWWYQSTGESWASPWPTWPSSVRSWSATRVRAPKASVSSADVGWFQRPERIVLLGVGFFLRPVFPDGPADRPRRSGGPDHRHRPPTRRSRGTPVRSPPRFLIRLRHHPPEAVTICRTRARSSVDRALASGARGRPFESARAYPSGRR